MARSLCGVVLPAALGAVEGAAGTFVAAGEKAQNGQGRTVSVVKTAADAAALVKESKAVALCEGVPLPDLDEALLREAAVVPLISDLEDIAAALERGAAAVCLQASDSGEAVRLVRTARRAHKAVRDSVYVMLPDMAAPSDVEDLVRMGAAAVVIGKCAADAGPAFVNSLKKAEVPLPTFATVLKPTTKDPFVSPRPPGNARQAHGDWQAKAAEKMMGGNSQRPGGLFEGSFSGGWGRSVFGDANAPARQSGYVFLDANTGVRRGAAQMAPEPGMQPMAKVQRLPESGGAWSRRFGPAFPHSS